VPEDDGWQRYMDAANALAQLARGRVEEIARDLLSTGEAEGDLARQWTDDLLERSRSVVDEVIDVVRAEVTRQVESLGLGSPEDLFRRLTETFGRYGRPDRSAPVRDAVAIDASSVTEPPRAARSEATGAASKQRAAKPRSADKKKAQKKASASPSGTPHAAAKAAQKSGSPKKRSAAKKSPAKKAAQKKSTGRGT
jgi:hypothetical protein